MRRLAALIIGVATAQPDIDAACRRPTYPDRYVVMLSAFEQMNKPPCVQAPAEGPAPTYRPTYKPSLRGSDDDDCEDDEDWSYTTKEGDVFKCDHVAEKTKRCTIRFSDDGVRADDACKKTCGTCK